MHGIIIRTDLANDGTLGFQLINCTWTELPDTGNQPEENELP